MSAVKDLQPRLSATERQAVRKIAIVRALQLGDLLLAVPALRAIRQGFPAAEITLIGLRWSSEFARRFSRYVDRWREFPGYPGLLEVDVDPDRTRHFLDAERAYRYDLALQLHGNGTTSNQFALELGGKRTAGFYVGSPPDGLFPCATYPDSLHEIDRNLAFARLLGLPIENDRLEFPLLPEDQVALHLAIPDGLEFRRPIVGLHPGARPSARRWPVEYYAELGDGLARQLGAQIVITGGPGDGGIAAAVADQMTTPTLNLAERTTIGSLAALLGELDLFISNDTGPAHVAVALDRPSITIFGPADRRRWAPLDQRRHRVAFHDVECSPCPHWDCPIDHRCLRRVEPRSVLEIAKDLLIKPPAGAVD